MILHVTTRVAASYEQLLHTDERCTDVEGGNLYREKRSSVIDRLELVDQVRHGRLADGEIVPDSVRERLMEIFDSWNTSTYDETAIQRKVRAEMSAFARELQARGIPVTERQLLRDSLVAGWREIRAKYSASHFPSSQK